MTPSTRPAPSITGLLLAGGRGARMSGVDKGLQLFHGEPLAAHVLRRLAGQVDALVISANRHLDDYAALGARYAARVVSDGRADFAGPLAGLAAGLRAARTPRVLCVPCDAPFVAADLASRLTTALDTTHADIAMATILASGGIVPQPTFALIDTALADDLAARFATGDRALRAWYARHKTVEVIFDDERAFYNVNSLQDLGRLERG